MKPPEGYITLKLSPEQAAQLAEPGGIPLNCDFPGGAFEARVQRVSPSFHFISPRFAWPPPGKKARRRAERLARALEIEDKVAADLRRMATDDIPALERALAMARHDVIACGGRHPAAQRFLEIAKREGIG